MSQNDGKGIRTEAPGRIIGIAIVILAGAVMNCVGDKDIRLWGGGFIIIGGIVFAFEYLFSCVRDVTARRERHSRKLSPLPPLQ